MQFKEISDMIDNDILQLCFEFLKLKDEVGDGLKNLTKQIEDDSDNLIDHYNITKDVTKNLVDVRHKITSKCDSDDLAILYIDLALCLNQENYLQAELNKKRIIDFISI